MDKVLEIIVTLIIIALTLATVGFGIWRTMHCWDIAIADRSGVCAINTQ